MAVANSLLFLCFLLDSKQVNFEQISLGNWLTELQIIHFDTSYVVISTVFKNLLKGSINVNMISYSFLLLGKMLLFSYGTLLWANL